MREDSEWQAAHAADAIHLSKGIIERDIETKAPDKGAKMVLYCGGGYRSALAADALQQMGYTNVISLDGGWRAWQQAGMPDGPTSWDDLANAGAQIKGKNGTRIGIGMSPEVDSNMASRAPGNFWPLPAPPTSASTCRFPMAAGTCSARRGWAPIRLAPL